METFYMMLTLSSLSAPQVLFFSQPRIWDNELACVHALPRMESAVDRLIRDDGAALELFGATTGALGPGHFVSAAVCLSAAPG